MKRTLLKAITIILIFSAIAFYGCSSCEEDEDVIRGEFEFRNYNKRFDAVTFTATPVNSITAGTNDINAALHLLEVANSNLITANYLASVSTGGGTASSSLVSMNGELQFGDIYIRDNGAFYSQSVARITSATSSLSGVNILSFAQALLDQADRKYSLDGQTFYVQKVTGNKATSRMIVDYPYGSADFTKGELESYNLEEYKAAEYVKANVGELSNFVFASDTILANTISITYADGLYTLSFEMNLEDTAAREKATEFSRANMREASSSDDLEYGMYKVTIEMYDNGLIRNYTKEESWEATLSLPLNLSPNGASHSITSLYYSWDPADCSFTTMNIDTAWAK